MHAYTDAVPFTHLLNPNIHNPLTSDVRFENKCGLNYGVLENGNVFGAPSRPPIPNSSRAVLTDGGKTVKNKMDGNLIY